MMIVIKFTNNYNKTKAIMLLIIIIIIIIIIIQFILQQIGSSVQLPCFHKWYATYDQKGS